MNVRPVLVAFALPEELSRGLVSPAGGLVLRPTAADTSPWLGRRQEEVGPARWHFARDRDDEP